MRTLAIDVAFSSSAYKTDGVSGVGVCMYVCVWVCGGIREEAVLFTWCACQCYRRTFL
jgi:hypothetical protein